MKRNLKSISEQLAEPLVGLAMIWAGLMSPSNGLDSPIEGMAVGRMVWTVAGITGTILLLTLGWGMLARFAGAVVKRKQNESAHE